MLVRWSAQNGMSGCEVHELNQGIIKFVVEGPEASSKLQWPRRAVRLEAVGRRLAGVEVGVRLKGLLLKKPMAVCHTAVVPENSTEQLLLDTTAFVPTSVLQQSQSSAHSWQ